MAKPKKMPPWLRELMAEKSGAPATVKKGPPKKDMPMPTRPKDKGC